MQHILLRIRNAGANIVNAAFIYLSFDTPLSYTTPATPEVGSFTSEEVFKLVRSSKIASDLGPDGSVETYNGRFSPQMHNVVKFTKTA